MITSRGQRRVSESYHCHTNLLNLNVNVTLREALSSSVEYITIERIPGNEAEILNMQLGYGAISMLDCF